MTYDAIVVGAGVEGSATAYYLAKNGQKTMLVEQFPLPHSRGSSHGQSRITRKAYTDDFYVKMMLEAYPRWTELETETGTSLFTQCGMLAMGTDGSNYIKEIRDALDKYHVPYEALSKEQLKTKYSISLPPDASGVLDPSGGILRADRAVRALQNQFLKFGGYIRDAETVTEIEPGAIVRIRTKKGTYEARKLVLCLGSWAGSFLSKHLDVRFPFKTVKITVCYFQEKNEGQYSVDRFPTFSFKRSVPYDMYYGLPAYEYPGLLKIFLHYGPEINPDYRDEKPDSSAQETSKKFVKSFFPEVKPNPVVTETCIYTMTPDEHFVLDRHPKWDNIIIGAGFSGHGFKLAPVVGRILGDLAMTNENSYDLTPFRLDRFNRRSVL